LSVAKKKVARFSGSGQLSYAIAKSTVSKSKISYLTEIAKQLRIDSIAATTAAKSGHPSSCLSCAELMAVLFFEVMKYDTPKNPDNDEFVLSKGHAAPILYSALFRAGKIRYNLLDLRKHNSPLQGHPIPRYLQWAKMATGSLGQGLANGIGMALSAKLQHRNYTTYVLMGDSELAEGSVWEAFSFASHHNVSNLVAIVDINRLGQTRETMIGHNVKSYQKRFESFGWHVVCVDGHSIVDLLAAFDSIQSLRSVSNKPVVILAKTFKGHGVDFIQNKDGWHGRALTIDEAKLAYSQIGIVSLPKKIEIKKPVVAKRNSNLLKEWDVLLKQKVSSQAFFSKLRESVAPIVYDKTKDYATRESYGDFITRYAKADPSLVVVDAEVGNSTFANAMEKADSKRFFECFIAEQNMIGIACGLAVKGHTVFCGSFAAFLTRAYDQLRMAGISDVSFTVVGSHGGVSIGEDGASQMGVEDLGMCKMIYGSSVFYPSDAVSAQRLLELSTQLSGLTYIRSNRPKTPIMYSLSEKFSSGGFKIVAGTSKSILKASSRKPFAVIATNGVLVHEALTAYDSLLRLGITVIVVDCYSLKPFDAKGFTKVLDDSGLVSIHGKKQIFVFEEHLSSGGLGDTIKSGLSDIGYGDAQVTHYAVTDVPSSGSAKELLADYSLDSQSMVKVVGAAYKKSKLK
jgi:transketolase